VEYLEDTWGHDPKCFILVSQKSLKVENSGSEIKHEIFHKIITNFNDAQYPKIGLKAPTIV
jgi:hypothetical protein